MKFQYQAALGVSDTRGHMVKRPVLEVELMGVNGKKITTLGILDSGADTTTINLQYAHALGIKVDDSDQREIMGIGNGRVKAFVSKIRLKIKHFDSEINLPVWFVDSENVDLLIGQEVFFDQHKIRFEKDHDTFEITEVRK